MSDDIQVGLTATSDLVVAKENTACHLGSGGVDVLATPELVRLMEQAAVAAVDPLLPLGQKTVGARIDIQHLAPTPLGMRVKARATLVTINGRRLTFDVEARDEREVVARGSHERVIVDLDRFRSRLAAKQSAG